MFFKRIAAFISVIVFLCVVTPAAMFAQSVPAADEEKLFAQANDFYRAGKYKEAADMYEQIAGNGFVNGNLYYNLGNSYFKEGEIGKAILNYERAGQFMPYDSDLKENLDYARSLVNAISPQYSNNRLLRRFYSLADRLSVDGITVFMSILFVCIFVLLACNIFSPVIRKYTVFFLTACVIVFSAAAFSLSWKINYLARGAVVIAKDAQARFEPSDNATAYFMLSQGSRIEVIDATARWFKIKRSDHKVGWVDKTAIELIRE
ncbi:MAG: SH3 domain-containing protein [Candidatus Omnitrophota bacterium]